MVSGHITIIFSFFILVAKPSKGQSFKDWNSLTSLFVQYKYDQKLSFTGVFQLHLSQKVSIYDKSVLGAGLTYQFNIWLKTGFSNRLGLLRSENYNEYRLFLSFNIIDNGRWMLKLQPLWQQRIYYQRMPNREFNLNQMIRTRITTSYVLSQKVELYLTTENYLRVDKTDWSFERQGSGLGTGIKIGLGNIVNSEFTVFNHQTGKTTGRIGFGFIHVFNREIVSK